MEVEIIDQTPFVASYLLNEGATKKDVYLFLAKVKSGEVKPQAGEVDVWQWATLTEAGNLVSDHYVKLWHQVIATRTNNQV